MASDREKKTTTQSRLIVCRGSSRLSRCFLTLASCSLGTEIMMATRSTNSSHRRNAFTLIEILVVITIIGILMSLILPAINGVRRRARVAQVKSEISTLESAIASYKAEFGIEPPGSLRLYATPAGWNTPIPGNAVDESIRSRSRAYLRQLWPQFDFNTALTMSAPFYVDSASNDCKELNGAECLVFFLGGVRDAATGTTMNGFSKSPTNPFSPSGSNRVKPFFDFNPARLVDKDVDGFFEYVDPLPSQSSPYLYFSSNDGRVYQSILYPIGSTAATATDWYNTDCCVDPSATPSWKGSATGANGNWMKHMYFSSFQISGTQAAQMTGSIPFAPKKYQIISPGFGGVGATPDKAYGTGGLFDPKNSIGLVGTADGDNITSFHGGTLSGE